MRAVLAGLWRTLGAPNFTVSITPPTSDTSTTFQENSSSHTGSVDVGTPSAYQWTVVSNHFGTGSISDPTAATTTLTVHTNNGGTTASVTFRCSITVNGVTKYADITKTHFWDTGA